MKKLLALISLAAILTFSTVYSAVKENFQIKKQPEIQQIKPKKPVRIKLKRASDGKYTWELTGDDVDEVVKADARLKKLLKIEK